MKDKPLRTKQASGVSSRQHPRSCHVLALQSLTSWKSVTQSPSIKLPCVLKPFSESGFKNCQTCQLCKSPYSEMCFYSAHSFTCFRDSWAEASARAGSSMCISCHKGNEGRAKPNSHQLCRLLLLTGTNSRGETKTFQSPCLTAQHL